MADVDASPAHAEASEASARPALAVAQATPLPEPPSAWSRLGFSFWLAMGWLALVVILALLAPVLPISDPTEIRVGGRFEGPRSGL